MLHDGHSRDADALSGFIKRTIDLGNLDYFVVGMAKTIIEKRLVNEGVKLCEQRIEQKGTMVTADDIRAMKVRTFSPALQAVYAILGAILFVFGMWFQFSVGNMAVSMGLVLIGFLNIAYGVNGRPKPASQIPGLDFADLTAEITRAFAERQDASKDSKASG